MTYFKFKSHQQAKSNHHFLYLKPNYIITITIAVIMIFSGCMTIEDVNQPQIVQVGKVFSTVLKVKIQCKKSLQNTHLIFGLMIPREWNHTKGIELTYKSNLGSGKLIEIPTQKIAPGSKYNWAKALFFQIGTGRNRVNDMQWLVFETDRSFTIKKDDPDISGSIYLKMRAGNQNLKVSLGYFLGNDNNGFQNEHSETVTYFGNPLEVIGGSTPEIDFLQPHQMMVTPITGANNCPLTIIFDGNIKNNKLSNSTEIFLHSKAYTNKGRLIEPNYNNSPSKFAPMGKNRWRLNLIPSVFYRLEESEKIEKIEFFLTNENGTLLVGGRGLSEPFTYLYSEYHAAHYN